jgi:hypothetical protein
MKIKPKQIFFSWDFAISLLVAFASFLLLKNSVSNDFSKDIYGIGISVLSIVFSVYFAALALIITSGDDDFIHFLEEKGDYTGIIDTFKFSLLSLFLALIYSIIAYTFTAAKIYESQSEKMHGSQPEVFICVFSFLFSYGLFAALSATLDSISYAMFRARFLKINRSNELSQTSYDDKES